MSRYSLRLIAALAFLCSPVLAQVVSVQGTITDQNGIPYSYGTITTSISKAAQLNGIPYSPPGVIQLDQLGNFTMTLGDNNILQPPGSTYSFKVCSSTAGTVPPFSRTPTCFTTSGVKVTGVAANLSSTLSASAASIGVVGTTPSSPCGDSSHALNWNGTVYGCQSLSTGTQYLAPSGDTTGGTDGNSITSACVAGAIINLAPSSVGTYYIGKSNSNNITVGAPCTIRGAGPGPTVIQSEDTTADWVTVNFNNVSNDATPPTPMPSGCLIDGVTLIADTGNVVTNGAGLRVGTNGSGYTYGCTFSHMDIKGAYYNVRQDPGFWMNTFEDMQLSMATSGDCVYFDTPSPGGDATWLNVRMIGASAGAPCNFYVNRADTNIISHLKFNNGKFVFSLNGISNLNIYASNIEGAANCAYDFSSASGVGMINIVGTEFELTGGNPELFNPICSAFNVQPLRATAICAGTASGTPAKCGDAPVYGFQAYDDLTSQNLAHIETTETNNFLPWVRTFTGVWNGTLSSNGSQSVQSSGISVNYINFTPVTPNYTVSAGCTDPGSGSGWCLIGSRLQSPASGTLAGYGCLFVQGTGVQLNKFSGSTPTVAQIGSTDTTFTSGTHTIAISSSNTKLTCVIDGVASATATGTDSTYTTAGNAWIGINNGSGSGYLINSPVTVQ